ncbi:hypothetical protein MPER_13886, partial [Moniliophthora perniciosa FA553]
KFTSSGPEMFASTQASTLAFRTNGTNKSGVQRPKVSTNGLGANNGVHVQMETFESPSSRTYHEQYDAMGNVITKGSPADDFDAEAQEIRDEFKRPHDGRSIEPSFFGSTRGGLEGPSSKKFKKKKQNTRG